VERPRLKIRPKTVDFRNLKLSPEEGFVLSRVDGASSVKELVALTGLDESRVVEIVDRLAGQGAVEIEGQSESPSPSAEVASPEPVAEPDEADGPLAPVPDEATDAPEGEEVGEDESETSDPEAAANQERNERSYRQIYETVYRPMERDLRLKAAKEVSGSDLLALCFDPEALVVQELLTNPNASVEHSRMIAQHHRTQMGLEAVARRAEHLKDGLIQRRLLRNPQLPPTILQRIVQPKLILDIYKTAIDREIPERSRILAREVLRKKFMLSSADEKAALLVKTEGRCLLHLTNCSLDSHATQLLCGKTTYTTMFVQNLSRWSATPPMLLSHLLKQPVVRNNMGLKKMLLKHPNMPSDAKRNA
jgi:hypothetical protein